MLRRLAIGLTALMLALAGAAVAVATISSSLNKVIVAGNASQTAFSFPFIGVAAADISVTFTDATGAQTVLVNGPGPTQYQLVLNAAVPPALWGIGGTVTYNPSGTPIASGTTLTILRTLPYVQLTSLQNQASFGQLAQATEQALDQLEMQIQQIAEAVTRVVQAPASDPAGINLTLPPAAQRANTGLAFDGAGNVIAGTTPATGVISSAMQPVVNAASLSAGRTAFGLNGAATGTINYGLQQGVSGANLIDVNLPPVQDSINQSVTAAFHMSQRICSGPITYTLPRANTTWGGFGFFVYAVAGNCTITPNGSDNFLGLASGASIAVPPGSWVFLSTSAAASGVWWVDYHGATNGNLAANAGAGALTLTLSSGPLQFRDTTLANGDPVWSLPAGGLTLTIPSGATLGTSSSNVPFRLWIFVAYNGGAPVLGVATCSSATQIYPCAAWETLRKSGTGISAGSTAAGTLYSASAVTNDSVIIVGYAEYASGLGTAGTWVSAPTTLQLCLPPRQCKKPGDVVQSVHTPVTGMTTGTNTYTLSNTAPTAAGGTAAGAATLVPTSAANLLRVSSQVVGSNSGDAQMIAFLATGSPALVTADEQLSATTFIATVPLRYQALAGSTSSVTFTQYLTGSAGTTTINGRSGAALMGGTAATFVDAEEIMGALEPANQNLPGIPALSRLALSRSALPLAA